MYENSEMAGRKMYIFEQKRAKPSVKFFAPPSTTLRIWRDEVSATLLLAEYIPCFMECQ